MTNFMLAKEYIEGKIPRGLVDYKPPVGWYASEKYDGYRAQYLPDKKQFISRQNKPFNAPEWFLKAMPPDHRLDGELWIGRDQFQEMGVVRKKKPIDKEWLTIRFCVYDLPDVNAPFKDRYELLTKLVKKNRSRWNLLKKQLSKELPELLSIDSPLIITKQIQIKSKQHMDEIYKNVIDHKGEGLMIKDPMSMYESKRSDFMLKYKPCFDAEGIIIDYKEGTNKYKGMLGAFVCKPLLNYGTYSIIDPDENHVFSISGMDDEIRKNYKLSHPVGTIITYEYSGLTNTGKPRFARYIRTRDDITLKDGVETSIKLRDTVVSIFKELETHEKLCGQHFKSKAYSNAIQSLSNVTDDQLTEPSLIQMKGIGKSLVVKIMDIVKTGTCSAYEKIKDIQDPREIFMNVHGIGSVKATQLMKQGIKTIDDLRKHQDTYLNDVQKKGLLYYEDVNMRIPQDEIKHHEDYLKKVLYNLPSSEKAELTIAGSYRRRKPDSGDIDILLNTPSVKNNSIYNRFIDELVNQGYIKETLSRGKKKYMGIAKLGDYHRRIDIMYTKPDEISICNIIFYRIR